MDALVVYAFVYPPGRDFMEASAERNAPAHYFEGMQRSMERMTQRLTLRFRKVLFRVHMHPACKSLAARLRNVDVAFCRDDDHWRYPVLARSATLVSHPGSETVLMLDGHDPPYDQAEAVRLLLGRMDAEGGTAGLTFWPTDGMVPPAERPSQGSAAREFQVFSTNNSLPWMVDCGLAVTTPAFRAALGLDYEVFLRSALTTYGNVWKDFEATSDEALLDAALMRGPLAPIVKANAAIMPHWLSAAPPFDLAGVAGVEPPEYTEKSNVSDELTGLKELLVAGQDITMDPARIKEATLRWGAAPVLLEARRTNKRTNAEREQSERAGATPAPAPAPTPAPATTKSCLPALFLSVSK